jgi:hypothetical protein
LLLTGVVDNSGVLEMLNDQRAMARWPGKLTPGFRARCSALARTRVDKTAIE